MKRRSLALIALASLFLCLGQEKRKQKPAQLEMIEFKAIRDQNKILIDGKVRNTGDLAAKDVILFFQFVSPDKKVVATRQADLEPREIEPGEDADFLLETPFPARAVFIRMETYDRQERWINLAKSGPYPIE